MTTSHCVGGRSHEREEKPGAGAKQRITEMYDALAQVVVDAGVS
jgi:hypothetical protein